MANTNTTLQRTQYYPSGLPWAESTGQSVQNKKYNGKEFVEAHGLDEYDSEARWYYPAIMRTTTLDPLAEKYYSISPYAWCGNNPVRMVDKNGKEFGNPLTGGVPSVLRKDGSYTAAMSSTYRPKLIGKTTIKLTNTQMVNKEINIAKSRPRGTITKTITETEKFMNVRSDFDKQMTSSPVIKGVAAGVVTTAVVVFAPEVTTTVSSIAVNAVSTAFSSDAVITATGFAAGAIYSTATDNMQDLPAITTGLPLFDTSVQAGQTAKTFLDLLNYTPSTDNNSNLENRPNDEKSK